MVNNEIFGYIGIFFAIIYRIPQIIKIYKNKKGEDISTKTFILHNCAYLFFLIYVIRKKPTDYLIVSYYIVGAIQNLIIVLMKIYYKKLNIDNDDT
jgi:uncharacterized protein with PQ loop repeat